VAKAYRQALTLRSKGGDSKGKAPRSEEGSEYKGCRLGVPSRQAAESRGSAVLMLNLEGMSSK
jgi:hypothetical protein